MIQYQIIFGISCVEAVFLFIILLPIPTAMRTLLLSFVTKAQRVLVVLFVVLLFFCAGSVFEVHKYATRLELLNKEEKPPDIIFQLQTANFFAERNMYLCASALFLLFIVLRLPSVIHAAVQEKPKTS